MKATELMIGNYILLNGEPKQVDWRVLQDMEKKEKTGDKIEYYRDMTFEPMPITLESMKLIGVTDVISNNIGDYFMVDPKKNLIVEATNNYTDIFMQNGFVGFEVEHIHQVQNIKSMFNNLK